MYVDIAVASAPSGWFGSGTHATRPADDMLMEIGSDIYTITGSTTLGTEQSPTGYRVNVVRTRTSNRSINDGLINAVSQGATVVSTSAPTSALVVTPSSMWVLVLTTCSS